MDKQKVLDKLTKYIGHYKKLYEERLNEQQEISEYLCGVIDAYESAKTLVESIQEEQESVAREGWSEIEWNWNLEK